MVSGQAVLVWKGKLRQQKGKQLELRLAIARMKVSLFSTSCHTLAEMGLSSLSPEISLGLQQVLRMALPPPDTESFYTFNRLCSDGFIGPPSPCSPLSGCSSSVARLRYKGARSLFVIAPCHPAFRPGRGQCPWVGAAFQLGSSYSPAVGPLDLSLSSLEMTINSLPASG